jgi:hypothetical protein
MARIKKLAGALTALGLAIGTSSASAFPLWNFGGGGGLGGDNQYTPYDGRYLVIPGDTSYMEYFDEGETESGLSELFISMELEGRAYNFPTTSSGAPLPEFADFVITDESGSDYVPLGEFAFEFTFFNPVLNVFPGDDPNDTFVDLIVPSVVELETNNGPIEVSNFGQGTLTYVNDTLFDASDPDIVDIQVEDEKEGDVIYFNTPDCNAIPGICVVDSENINFFEWFGTVGGGPSSGSTTEIDITNGPVALLNATGIALNSAPIYEVLPTEVLSLFHGGLPCYETSAEYDGLIFPTSQDAPSDFLDQARNFFCNPLSSNFPTVGITIGNSPYATYESFVRGHAAQIDVNATFVPTPAVIALLAIGIAGMGFTRRRS